VRLVGEELKQGHAPTRLPQMVGRNAMVGTPNHAIRQPVLLNVIQDDAMSQIVAAPGTLIQYKDPAGSEAICPTALPFIKSPTHAAIFTRKISTKWFELITI